MRYAVESGLGRIEGASFHEHQEAVVTERTGSDANMAEPPGGGRQDHDVMWDAANRSVSGPASIDTLAAGGGLQVPGREIHTGAAVAHDSGRASPVASSTHPHRSESGLIPGERDASTLTHREPGAVGGQFAGADIPAGAPASMDERTATEHAREGGGDIGVKSHNKHR
jgi:hypothetical protein